MNSLQTFASIIQDIAPEQILPLIHEQTAVGAGSITENIQKSVVNLLNLKNTEVKNKVHIMYVVDPYDILAYCFPFGFRLQENIDGSKLDKHSDRLTAWDNFFTAQPQIILMDEHRAELGRLRNRLIRDMKVQIREFDEFEKLVVEIYGKKGNLPLTIQEVERLKEEIFQKRLPWLIAAATGELHNGPKRFQNVLEKLIIDPEDTNKDITAEWLDSDEDRKIHTDRIKDIFKHTLAGDDAFKKFQETLDLLDDKNVTVSINRRGNLLVDFKVTDRILKINKKFEEIEEELQCRYVVLYLSSDLKSEYISQDLYYKCPKVFGQPLNLMRNVAQLWLQFLMTVKIDNNKQKDDTTDKIIQNLLIAHNILKNRKLLPDGDINNRIIALREQVEWYGLIKNISAYPDKLKSIFEDLQNKSNFEPLKQAFAELIDILNNTSGKEGLILFEKKIRNYNIQVTTLQKIISILDADISPDISSLGYVVGINHHLPTLFEKIGNNSKYEMLVDNAVNLILSPNDKNNFSSDLKNFAIELKLLLIADDIPDFQFGIEIESESEEVEYYQRQMLLHLFALLLPAKNLQEQDFNSVLHFGKVYNLDSELDELISYDIKYLTKKINTNLNNKPHEKSDYVILLKNLLYIRIWSLRRNGKLDECLTTLNRAQAYLKKFSDHEDIRFIHGKALLSYSILLRYMDDNSITPLNEYKKDIYLRKYWKRVQQDCETAVNAFEMSVDTYFSAIPFRKAYSAMVNTLIYVYIIGHSIGKDQNRLIIARNIFDQKLNLFKEDYFNNPEYMHTEAILKYFESNRLLSIDETSSYQKILDAYNIISKCISIHNKIFPNKPDPDYDYLKIATINFAKLNFNVNLKVG